MSDRPVLLQADTEAAVTIAVLYERTSTLGREMREMKEAQREQMAELRMQNKAMSEKMDDVLALMNRAQGGVRTLLMVGGTSGTLGAGAAWLLQFLTHR